VSSICKLFFFKFDADNIPLVRAKQSTGIPLVDSNLQIITNAKQTQLLAFGHFVIMPTHLVNRFVAPEIKRKTPSTLDLVEKVFADVADDVSKRINEDHATAQVVFFHDGLDQRSVDHRIDGIADFRKRAALCKMARGLTE